jgi:putative ATPase
MKELNYGKEYMYAHSYPNNFVIQDYMPDEIKDKRLYTPQGNPQEIKVDERLNHLWKDRYK